MSVEMLPDVSQICLCLSMIVEVFRLQLDRDVNSQQFLLPGLNIQCILIYSVYRTGYRVYTGMDIQCIQDWI